MSLVYKVHCNNVSKDLIPKMMERLNEFDMVVSIHPDFKFDPDEDAGFLPFKFRFKNPPFEVLRNKDLKSGFEMYIDKFNLKANKDSLNPKLSLLDKLLGKKKQEIFYAEPEIEDRLKDCNFAVLCVWRANNSFELRFVLLVSAILTELTNGICSFDDDETWLDNQDIVENAFQEAIEYEQSIPEEKLDFYEFDEW